MQVHRLHISGDTMRNYRRIYTFHSFLKSFLSNAISQIIGELFLPIFYENLIESEYTTCNYLPKTRSELPEAVSLRIISLFL